MYKTISEIIIVGWTGAMETVSYRYQYMRKGVKNSLSLGDKMDVEGEKQGYVKDKLSQVPGL